MIENMDIKHDLLPKQKPRKHGLNVVVDLFPLATELYEEIDKLKVSQIPVLYMAAI